MSVQEVLAGEKLWEVEHANCLDFMAGLPPDSIDLIFGSPPYVTSRLYLEGGEDLGIARGPDEWVAWMLEVCRAARRVCKGLVAFVVEGRTESYRYDCTPFLLMADLHREGFHLRKPAVYRRVGIPGSGGLDWLRNDWEPIVAFTRGGRLPWSDNTACGHAPKWAPGGEMSHRVSDGTRVNQWGGHARSCQQRRADGSRQPPGRPSHKVVGGEPVDEGGGLPGIEPVPSPEGRNEWGMQGGSGMRRPDGNRRTHGKPHTKRRAGSEAARTKSFDQPNGTTEDQNYTPPAIANPGNIIQEFFTAEEVADMLGEATDIVDCTVGGGQMGHRLAHLNEAPFPESLAEFFVRSFCPPGGVCLDPFSGSGTTSAVTIRCGRRALGCDVRQSQVELSRKRVSQETPSLFGGISQ